MLYLTHHDDKKSKYKSHEISLSEDEFYNNKLELFSHNPFDICAYGDSKEEAFSKFKKQFKYIMDELRAFEYMLMEDDYFDNSIKEVDCFGNEVSQ